MSNVRPGRPEAAAAIWSPRRVREEPTPAPSGPAWRGVIQALIGGTVGCIVFFFWARSLGSMILTLATVIGLSALFSPRGLYALIERFFLASGDLLGRALNYVLMPALLYLVFMPFGLLFRRGRRDSMKRFYDATANSYWEPCDPVAPDQRQRQY